MLLGTCRAGATAVALFVLGACMPAGNVETLSSGPFEPVVSWPFSDDNSTDESASERLVTLADGQQLPDTHPDVLAAVVERQEERAQLRAGRADERSSAADLVVSEADWLDEWLAPDGPREAGAVACEHHKPAWCSHAATFLDDLPFNWTQVGWVVVVHDNPPDDIAGLARAREKALYVFPADHWSRSGLERVIAHELGHAVDLAWWSQQDRHRWRVWRGIGADVSHWAGQWQHDYDVVGEDVAEVFAAWVTGMPSRSAWEAPDDISDVVDLLWPPGCDRCPSDLGGMR